MIPDDLIACEVCAEFDTGPLMERPRPERDSGTVLHDEESKKWTESRQFEDGWIFRWHSADEDDYIAFCSYHSQGLQVPREPGTATIGDVTVDLQEFDYIGDRINVAHFKHITTRCYLNLRVDSDDVVAGELLNGRWVSYPVTEGFARARSRELRDTPIAVGTRVYTAYGPGRVLRPKFDPQFWVVAFDSGDEDVVSETDMIGETSEPPPAETQHVD